MQYQHKFINSLQEICNKENVSQLKIKIKDAKCLKYSQEKYILEFKTRT